MFSHLFKSADTHIGFDWHNFILILLGTHLRGKVRNNKQRVWVDLQADRQERLGTGNGSLKECLSLRWLPHVCWRNLLFDIQSSIMRDTSGCASPFETRLKTLNMILHLKVWNNFLLAFSKVINQQRGVVELPKDWQDRVGMGNGLTADALIAHVHGQSRGHHTRVKDRLLHV